MTTTPSSAYYFSQWDSDASRYRGDCVPTCAKMMIDWYTSQVFTVDSLAVEMGTTDQGTPGSSASPVITAHGVPNQYLLRTDVSWGAVLGQVALGRYPVLFVMSSYLYGRQDSGFNGLHAVWLVDSHGQTFDPDTWGTQRGPSFYSLSDLQAGWETGAGGLFPFYQEGDYMTDAEIKAAVERLYNLDATVAAVKDRLAIDAHHTHTNPATSTSQPN